jgi:hypothetical protein
MKHCRERALALFEVGEKSKIPEYEIKAIALAQIWLTLAIIDDQLAIRASQVERETH